jgi:cyclophilin family peptidyl-prolyl cis-trans isomerase/HEAT repeat protein
VPLLSARDASVRTEAANALAQAVGSDLAAADVARRAVMKRLAAESDPEPRAALCEALGRMPISQPSEFHVVAGALLEASKVRFATGAPPRSLTPSDAEEIRKAAIKLVGALRGFESLFRLRGKIAQAATEVVQRLREIAVHGANPLHRRLAILALNSITNGPDAETLTAASSDDDRQVRRLAAASPAAGSVQLVRAMSDPAPMVRYEALRAWGRRFQADEGCAPALRAVGDVDGHTALLAIDLLGSCAGDVVAVEVLSRIVGGTSWTGRDGQLWHRPAHALVALAKVAPDRAKPELARAANAEAWQARMYAAGAAATLADAATLTSLAADAHANVREAAVSGLSRTVKHQADAAYLSALAAADNQLVMTAARALDGTPDPGAALPALLGALARFTVADSDTARDPRLALLERIRQLGSKAQAGQLKSYLSDRDPRVAEIAAKALTEWTGEPHRAAPLPPRAEAVPDEAELDRLLGAALRVHMKDLGVFEAVLLVDDAPLSCARVARLAQAGYYNGLTFHRVVPNFLIQGGSPGANEYVGHDRYMRDEVGRVSHHRGAMGISTRGRDTGDAQFYVDTVDVPRLDHEYTVFAMVLSGMEVVDAVLEGAVMEKVEVVLGVYEIPGKGRLLN